MQKIKKTFKEMKKALKIYEVDYIIVDIKAKFRPKKAKKKNK